MLALTKQVVDFAAAIKRSDIPARGAEAATIGPHPRARAGQEPRRVLLPNEFIARASVAAPSLVAPEGHPLDLRGRCA